MSLRGVSELGPAQRDTGKLLTAISLNMSPVTVVECLSPLRPTRLSVGRRTARDGCVGGARSLTPNCPNIIPGADVRSSGIETETQRTHTTGKKSFSRGYFSYRCRSQIGSIITITRAPMAVAETDITRPRRCRARTVSTQISETLCSAQVVWNAILESAGQFQCRPLPPNSVISALSPNARFGEVECSGAAETSSVVFP